MSNLPPLPPLPPRPQKPNSGNSQPAYQTDSVPFTQNVPNMNQPVDPQYFHNQLHQQPVDPNQYLQQSNIGQYPTAQPPKKKNKTLFIVLGAVLAVIVLVVAAVFMLNPFKNITIPISGGEGTSSDDGGSNTPATPAKTTVYENDPIVTSDKPLNPDTVLFSEPSFPGFDGGTTYVSLDENTVWEPKTEVTQNEDITSQGFDALYRGFGACTMAVNVIADGDIDELRWSGEGQEEEAVKLYLSLLFNSNADPSTFEKEEPILFPTHSDSKGQIPGYAYRIPPGETGQLSDSFITFFFDYNTGRATAVGVACLTTEDGEELYNEMINMNPDFSLYIDVK